MKRRQNSRIKGKRMGVGGAVECERVDACDVVVGRSHVKSPEEHRGVYEDGPLGDVGSHANSAPAIVSLKRAGSDREERRHAPPSEAKLIVALWREPCPLYACTIVAEEPLRLELIWVRVLLWIQMNRPGGRSTSQKVRNHSVDPGYPPVIAYDCTTLWQDEALVVHVFGQGMPEATRGHWPPSADFLAESSHVDQIIKVGESWQTAGSNDAIELLLCLFHDAGMRDHGHDEDCEGARRRVGADEDTGSWSVEMNEDAEEKAESRIRGASPCTKEAAGDVAGFFVREAVLLLTLLQL